MKKYGTPEHVARDPQDPQGVTEEAITRTGSQEAPYDPQEVIQERPATDAGIPDASIWD